VTSGEIWVSLHPETVALLTTPCARSTHLSRAFNEIADYCRYYCFPNPDGVWGQDHALQSCSGSDHDRCRWTDRRRASAIAAPDQRLSRPSRRRGSRTLSPRPLSAQTGPSRRSALPVVAGAARLTLLARTWRGSSSSPRQRELCRPCLLPWVRRLPVCTSSGSLSWPRRPAPCRSCQRLCFGSSCLAPSLHPAERTRRLPSR